MRSQIIARLSIKRLMVATTEGSALAYGHCAMDGDGNYGKGV